MASTKVILSPSSGFLCFFRLVRALISIHLDNRFTQVNEDMVDFVVQEPTDGNGKLQLIPFSNRSRLLSFAIKAGGKMNMADLRRITKDNIFKNRFPESRKLWRRSHSFVLRKLRELSPSYPGVIPQKVLPPSCDLSVSGSKRFCNLALRGNSI